MDVNQLYEDYPLTRRRAQRARRLSGLIQTRMRPRNCPLRRRTDDAGGKTAAICTLYRSQFSRNQRSRRHYRITVKESADSAGRPEKAVAASGDPRKLLIKVTAICLSQALSKFGAAFTRC